MVGLSSVVVGVFCLSLVSRPVQAEVYVAGQFGASIPNSFSNLKSDAGQSLSNLNLQDSFVYGAKLGYYSDSIKWLGVETEIFNSTPNVDQSGATPGRSLRVLNNWSPITLVARLPLGFVEPDAGIGMGVYFANSTANGEKILPTLQWVLTRSLVCAFCFFLSTCPCLANGNTTVRLLTSPSQAPRKQLEELAGTTARTFSSSGSAGTSN